MTGPARSPWTAGPELLPPPVGEIHVFAFSLECPAPRLAERERLLASDELERANRFRAAQDRRRYVVARAWLREILGRYLGRDPRALEFRYGPHGKPALRGAPDHEQVRFNSSRSHELGMVAVQLDEDVGIDLERVRPFPDALDIAKRFFAPDEHAVLSSLSTSERDAAFFSYWTRKEAIVKSISLGLSHPMDSFVLTRPPDAAVEQVTVSGIDGPMVRWSLPVPPPSEGYLSAVATAGGARPLRCWLAE